MGFRVLGCRVWGVGFRGFELGFWGLGFQDLGVLGFWGLRFLELESGGPLGLQTLSIRSPKKSVATRLEPTTTPCVAKTVLGLSVMLTLLKLRERLLKYFCVCRVELN